MAAPRFAPGVPINTARGYASPDVVPPKWRPNRPADIEGRQPVGERFGWQGPDQGYALKLAALVRPDIVVQDGESVDDALVGIVATALRRASIFGRAPVIHDLRLAQRIWGFGDAAPSAELLAARRPLFDGLALGHRQDQLAELLAAAPEATLRATPASAPALTF